MESIRISVCGVVSYPCRTCGEWIREHEAIWADGDGHVGIRGGSPHCPACLPLESRKAKLIVAALE